MHFLVWTKLFLQTDRQTDKHAEFNTDGDPQFFQEGGGDEETKDRMGVDVKMFGNCKTCINIKNKQTYILHDCFFLFSFLYFYIIALFHYIFTF